MTNHLSLQIYDELVNAYNTLQPDRAFLEILDKYPHWNVNDNQSEYRHFIGWRDYSSSVYIRYLERGGKLNFTLRDRESSGSEGGVDVQKNTSVLALILTFGLSHSNIDAFHYILDHHAADIDWNYGTGKNDCEVMEGIYIYHLMENSRTYHRLPLIEKILRARPNYLKDLKNKSNFLKLVYSDSPFMDRYGFNAKELNCSASFYDDALARACEHLSLFNRYGFNFVNVEFFQNSMLPQLLNIDSEKTNYCQKLLTSIIEHNSLTEIQTFFNALFNAPFKISNAHFSHDILKLRRLNTIERCFDMLSEAQQILVYNQGLDYMKDNGEYLFLGHGYFLNFERLHGLSSSYELDYNVTRKIKKMLLPHSVQCLLDNYPHKLDLLLEKQDLTLTLSAENRTYLKKHIGQFLDFNSVVHKKLDTRPVFTSLQNLKDSFDSVDEKDYFTENLISQTTPTQSAAQGRTVLKI